MKRISVIFLCLFIICYVNIGALAAYQYPAEFWDLNAKYESALEKGYSRSIATYGEQIIDLMKNRPNAKEKRLVLASRYREVAVAYLKLGFYETSAKYFNLLKELVDKYPGELNEWVEIADKATTQMNKEIKLYTDRGTPVYYGAKNEKRNGVLFGTNVDGEVRNSGVLDNESMTIIYQEFGNSLLPYNVNEFKKASESGLAVEFALNCPNEAGDIRNVKNMTSYLAEISDLFSEYPDTPVYLRFAAEFDSSWENKPNMSEFKSAFKFVSEYFKSRNSNVAMVWSPTQAASYDVNVSSYYPGDEYVDWIGLSSYASMYTKDGKNADELEEMWFKKGNNSAPVVAVKDFIEEYGNRKPIMLSESGSAHYLFGGLNIDTTDFALKRMREYYTYLPMIYPQIKLIAHFDNRLNGEFEDFRLASNQKIKDEYLSLTKGQRFIQDGYNGDSGYCYREIGNGTEVNGVFEVSCYAHLYGRNIKRVIYYIDDKYAGESNKIPFTAMLDASAYNGKHTLKAVVEVEGRESETVSSQINIYSDNKPITVKISGNKIEFDQEPVLYNDRTMVPMRKIFETLGAQVSWDDNTSTAIGEKDGKRIEVTIGRNIMYINNKKIQLDAPAIELSGRTLVPVRAIAEGLGCDVGWDDKNYFVLITPENNQSYDSNDDEAYRSDDSEEEQEEEEEYYEEEEEYDEEEYDEEEYEWSEWTRNLPDHVDEDDYRIQEKVMYSYREKKYYITDEEEEDNEDYLDDIDKEYGEWSDWDDEYIEEDDWTDVQVKTVEGETEYFYGHYCTEETSDGEDEYECRDDEFHDECDYHKIGWLDYELEAIDEDETEFIYFDDDGELYECKNGHFVWYLLDESEDEKEMYRQRDIEYIYTYWRWGDWSDFDEDDPYEEFDEDEIDVRERVYYRYKRR